MSQVVVEDEINLLEITLHSPAFLSGLDEVIRITNEKGWEAMFELEKAQGDGEVYYPPFILVGDEHSVGEGVGGMPGISRLMREFDDIYGIGNSETRTETRSFQEYAKDARFLEFCNHKERIGEGIRVPFPYRPRAQEPNDKNLYKFLHLHTHPNYKSIPSEGDLFVLRKMGFFNPETPIGIIVEVYRNSDSYKLMVLQEKEKPKSINALSFVPSNEEFVGFYNGGAENPMHVYHKCLMQYVTGRKPVILYGTLNKFRIA